MPSRRNQYLAVGSLDTLRSHIDGGPGANEGIGLDDDSSHDNTLRLVVVKTSLVRSESNPDKSIPQVFDPADFGREHICYGNGLHKHNNAASPSYALREESCVAESFSASPYAYDEWLTISLVAQATFSVAQLLETEAAQ